MNSSNTATSSLTITATWWGMFDWRYTVLCKVTDTFQIFALTSSLFPLLSVRSQYLPPTHAWVLFTALDLLCIPVFKIKVFLIVLLCTVFFLPKRLITLIVLLSSKLQPACLTKLWGQTIKLHTRIVQLAADSTTSKLNDQMTRLKTSVVAKPTGSNVFISVAGAASASPPPQCHQLHTSDKRDPWTRTHLSPGILTQRWILEHEYNVTGRAVRQRCTYRIILRATRNKTRIHYINISSKVC
jgi:hypothetical protein